MTFVTVFTVVSVLLVVTDCYLAVRAFKNHSEMGRYLGGASLLAVFVTLSYMCSVFSHSYMNISIASSCYFAGIDWMLVLLVHFAYVFTGRPKSRRARSSAARR